MLRNFAATPCQRGARHARAVKLQALWPAYQSCWFHPKQRAQFSCGAIISVWVPFGEPEPFHKARKRGVLRLTKLRRRHRFTLLYGGDRQMDYRELSAMIDCQFSEALQIAKAWQQLAFYWCERRNWYLVETSSADLARLLGRWRAQRHHGKLPSHNFAMLGNLSQVKWCLD
ncbi:hypothetical protein ACFOEE_02990 [Pseudoalteromonas fenneropenaei]|uniref:Uncharacterized protein n=1 Tax=Pseudoalteromonas fenneropenaei TaxID=1737459 RepID=A0ABV7CFV1_9GAMM